EMKVIFRDNRVGEITDIFCVPAAELTADQLAQKGLTASALDWETSTEPALPPAGETEAQHFAAVLQELQALVGEMNGCERARKDIAGWHRTVLVKAAGGEFTLKIADGELTVEPDKTGPSDFVMVCPDPKVLLDGLAYRGSLTQAIMTRNLWISKNIEFNTIFKLERMARSLARSKKV
ncbi:MAG TPA: hypothetical protein PLY40_03345, partial [Bacillota bacterium]|nr:hypothetical protein [Bacillota bacterium]